MSFFGPVDGQEIAKGNRIIQSLHQSSKDSKAEVVTVHVQVLGKVKLKQKSSELAHFERSKCEGCLHCHAGLDSNSRRPGSLAASRLHSKLPRRASLPSTCWRKRRMKCQGPRCQKIGMSSRGR